MRNPRIRGAAPLAGAALAFSVLISTPAAATAQFARIVPPPPCVVPAELQIRRTALRAKASLPIVIVEPLDVTNAERRNIHLPVGLATRLRDRLRATGSVSVVTDGTFERALYEAGGSADSAAALIAADWIVSGQMRSGPGYTDLTVTLHKRGAKTADWTATHRLPPRTLASAEQAIMEELVVRLPRKRTTVPAAAPGAPRLGSGDNALAHAAYLLRDQSVAAADSARRVLERAFGADTSSTQLAMALADAYNAVATRGGVSAPVRLDASLRRVNDLTTYVLAREPKSASAWTARAVAARLRDSVAFAGAIEAHAKAIALAPKSADAALELARTYLMLGLDDKAASELRRVLSLRADDGAALAALAGIHLRARRYREACAYGNAAVAAAPFDARAYSVRARARVHLGQARDAYADAETAARLSNEVWTKGLRFVTEIGAGNTVAATQLSRILASAYLGANSVLTVEDAAMLAAGWVRLGDTKRAVQALSRARPKGRVLATALRDPVFDPLRKDSTFRSLLAPAVTKGTDF